LKEILIIGCGKIGALYDINGLDINTHAKALNNFSDYSVSIYDNNKYNIDKTLANFNFKQLNEIRYDFDLIIIASTTNTHFQYLKGCIEHQVPTVICEKPVSLSTKELDYLKKIYPKGDTKIFINYIRQFLPEYIVLKDIVTKKINDGDKIVKVGINYTRGFINNSGHAFNLIQYILGQLNISEVSMNDYPVYEIDNDPTVSLNLQLNNGIPCVINGLASIRYNFFEMEIFLEKSYFKILNAGNKIVYKKIADDELDGAYKKALITENIFKNEEILDDYMLKVYQEIMHAESDNFLESLNLNQELINIISNV
jgi:predicted dehydrogenase